MPYQYVREPLTAEESDRLANACDTPTEKLVVWTLLDGVDPTVVLRAAISWQTEPLLTFRRSVGAAEAVRNPHLTGVGPATLDEKRLL